MTLAATIVGLAIAIAFVGWPIFQARARGTAGEGGLELDGLDESATRLADLERRKQLAYEDIRDAEMDLHAGKLSREDFEQLDRELRAEAIEILKRIDAATAR